MVTTIHFFFLLQEVIVKISMSAQLQTEEQT